MHDDFIFPRWHPLARLALFAAFLGGLSWLGREFTVPSEPFSAVWLPSGLVLSALLMSPPRHWPAVALTTIAMGFSHVHPDPAPVLTLLVSTCGALEGLLGAFLLRRLVGPRLSLHRLRDVIGLVTLAAGLSTLPTSFLSVALIEFEQEGHWQGYWYAWRVFWTGEAMGVLVLTPLLLIWLQGSKGGGCRRRWELGALLLFLGLATHTVFRGEPLGQWTFHPLIYLAFPCILWAALRFGAHGTTAATVIFSAIALWHTSHGHGPFAIPVAEPRMLTSSHSLVMLQSFLGAVSISGLLLAAALGERRHAQLKVSALNEELRQSLEKLARTQSELLARERMAALGELSATVAHEVRNPLGAIANCVSALRHLPGRQADAQEGPLLDIITEEVQRLDQLVRGLLDFARPVQPQLRPESLEALVEGALSAVLRAQTTAGVTVRRQVAPELPPALVDAPLLHVALSNLFTNALQAMPEGGSIDVRIGHEELAGASRLRLSISDTGRGMAPEVQQRIFEPFFTTRPTGTGLGLPIVRRIVEGHSGQVEVRSAEAQGTTFTLLLPCAAPAHAHSTAL